MGARDAGRSAEPRPRAAVGSLARRARRARPAGASADEDARRARRSVHRISAPRARRRLCALDAAAGALPDARRSRGLAGADLRAAADRRGRDDAPGSLAAMMAAPLRGLQDPCRAAVLPRPFRRLDRQIVLVDALAALNSGPAALRRSRTCAGRGAGRVSRRPRLDASPRSSGRASTASCSPRPRPTICTTPATTGSRRLLRLLTAKAIARAEGVGRGDRRHRARRDPRHPRGRDPPAAARSSRRSSACPKAGETLGGETFNGVAEAAVFPGELPADPGR